MASTASQQSPARSARLLVLDTTLRPTPAADAACHAKLHHPSQSQNLSHSMHGQSLHLRPPLRGGRSRTTPHITASGRTQRPPGLLSAPRRSACPHRADPAVRMTAISLSAWPRFARPHRGEMAVRMLPIPASARRRFSCPRSREIRISLHDGPFVAGGGRPRKNSSTRLTWGTTQLKRPC